jgi:hypothetical protein
LKDWSLYYLKEMLMRFMIKQAVEHLKPVLQKSAATQSRAGLTHRYGLKESRPGFDNLTS